MPGSSKIESLYAKQRDEGSSPSRTTFRTVACPGVATETPNLCGWVQLLPAVPTLPRGPTTLLRGHLRVGYRALNSAMKVQDLLPNPISGSVAQEVSAVPSYGNGCRCKSCPSPTIHLVDSPQVLGLSLCIFFCPPTAQQLACLSGKASVCCVLCTVSEAEKKRNDSSMVEHMIVDHGVAGSSPVHPTLKVSSVEEQRS